MATLSSIPKIPKPSAPSLDNIIIDHDLHCTIKDDELLCKIISNTQKLLKYICKLEAAPVWHAGSEKLCNDIPEEKSNTLIPETQENKNIILSASLKIQ